MSIEKETLKEAIALNVKTLFRKNAENATKAELYEAAAYAIRDTVFDKWMRTHETYYDQDVKVVYYLSMEFLMGRFLGNNLLSLSVYDEFKEAFADFGITLNEIEDVEPDPGLGNGGLGRLAACFLDSLSTLGYPAYGSGIRYRYGVFEQQIENGYQVELPDNWLRLGDPWSIKRKEYAVEVKFGGSVKAEPKGNGEYRFVQEGYTSVIAIPFDYPVVGFRSNTVNTLRLWEARAKTQLDLKLFNEGDYQKAVEEKNLADTISEVLYPADEHYQGKELRLKQQYFFISATVQRVISRFKSMHDDFSLLPDKVAFQLNDTHPSVVIAELMRILVDENDISWDKAWEITTKTCAYTNHTILCEALEMWPVELISRVLPRIYQIIEEINRRFIIELSARFGNDHGKLRKMAVIADGQVRMAHLAIVGSHSVNGVAKLHTEILINRELKDFYELYPGKFNNKTNGITQRRWLLHANPRLAEAITKRIGDGWTTDLRQISRIMDFAGDKEFRDEISRIKRENKEAVARFVKERKGIDIDPNSIFDIQIKRLHEYKRQLLNILHIIYLYNKLKTNPALDMLPRTFIFSAKASASYHRAKLIIKLINNVAEVINNDASINGRIKVVFIENYSVSIAEKLIPAADVSEQISTAGKEASGTGNMKLMLNGAITLGTMDGANVEIYNEVGEDNIFIFGLTADEIEKKREENSYDPWFLANMNQNIRFVLTSLINGTFTKGEDDIFRELYDSLLNGGGCRPDEYFVLDDFEDYAQAQRDINEAYKDRERWLDMSIANIAKSGMFSSDRTIEEYASQIWDLKKVKIEMKHE